MNKHSFFLWIALASAGMALGADATFAGTAGALRGITRDPDGQPLAQAQVTIRNVA